MKTSDLFKSNRSAKRINESIEKTFGKKLNLENFDLEQLQDARNKLRTQVSQVRNSAGFNENLDNDAYHQAQWMLDAINSEIAEREEFVVDAGIADVEEGFGTLEDEVRKLLDKFEQSAMEIGAYGNPDIEGIASLIAQGDYEGAADEVYGSYADQDGGEVPQLEPMIQDLQDEFEALGDIDPDTDPDEGGETDDNYALASAGFGSDEDYESIQHEASDFVKGVKRFIKGKKSPSDVRDSHLAKSAFSDDPKVKDKEGKRFDKVQNVISKESIQGEEMTKVTEGEIQQASAIVTAKTMVDRVGRWIEELSGMENDTLLQLGDSIRDEMGQEQAKTFISSVAPAIQQALENLKATREALSSGVRTLTGEEQAAGMLGAEPGSEEEIAPAAPDDMNMPAEEPGAPEDEFAAAEPAAGGAEEAGRAKRESIDRSNRLMKVLAG